MLTILKIGIHSFVSVEMCEKKNGNHICCLKFNYIITSSLDHNCLLLCTKTVILFLNLKIKHCDVPIYGLVP